MSSRAIRIVEATPSIPCCSWFGKLPESIRPNAPFDIPIAIRTAGRSGPLRVGFVVRTDSPSLPVIRLFAEVMLVEEIEIKAQSGSRQLAVGEQAKATYRVVHRRVRADSQRPPSAISMIEPFEANFEGVPTEMTM